MTTASTIAFTLLVVVLVAAAVWDIRSAIIPNRLTYAAIAGGLLFWLVAGFFSGAADPASGALTTGAGMPGAMHKLADAAVALAAGFLPFAVLFYFANALGGGDAKLMGAVGALSASWQCVVDTALLAFAFGMLFALALMVRNRIIKRTIGRVFAAMLSLAARVEPNIDSDSPRVPFGAAIACGGILAGMKHLLDLQLPLAEWGM